MCLTFMTVATLYQSKMPGDAKIQRPARYVILDERTVKQKVLPFNEACSDLHPCTQVKEMLYTKKSKQLKSKKDPDNITEDAKKNLAGNGSLPASVVHKYSGRAMQEMRWNHFGTL